MPHVFGMNNYMGGGLWASDSLSILPFAYSHFACVFNALTTNNSANKGSRTSMQYKMVELYKDKHCTILALLQSVTTSGPK